MEHAEELIKKNYSEMRDEYEKCCCGNATVNYLLYCYVTCVTVSNIRPIYVICTVPDIFV